MARPLTANDLYLLREVTDCVLHPDGRRVVFVVSWCDEETDANRSQLWLHDGTAARPLTFGHADHTPTFSPDGRWLAYLSAPHQSPAQLKVLPTDGGEAQRLTAADDGVGEPAWMPDSAGLLFTAPVRPEHQRGRSKEELGRRPEPRVIDTTQFRYNGRGWIHDRRRHVFLVRLPEPGDAVAAPVQLTDGPWDDASPSPSPDGRSIAFLSARHDDREWVGGNDVWVQRLGGARPARRTDGGTWGHVRWLDEQRLLAHGATERSEVRLASWHEVDAGRVARPRRIGDGEVACGGLLYGRIQLAIVRDALYTQGIRRGAVHVDRYDLATGRRTTVVGGERVVKAFAATRDGRRVVFAATGTNTPAELHERTGRTERALSDVSGPFRAQVVLQPMEEIETRSADGSPVHGFVCPAVRAGRGGRRRGPGLLYIHGGPLAQYSLGFFDEFQLAAAAGYTVIGVNPRGSDGYGQAHASAIVGAWGGLDHEDVLAAADALAARSDVEPARVGIGGGSYGGFLTAWTTAHTDRFKAALVERAVTNLVTMEATSDIGWFIGVQAGATTFTDIDRLRRLSPITHVASVRTPTLVVHSEEDWRCPPEQGEQWFAALRRLGVDTQFVRFPGENHELTRAGRPSLRVARFGHVHGWFDRYLK